MPTTPELPPRPEPPRTFGVALAGWLRWFGVGRLIVGALSVLIVLGGAAWLLQVPAPAPEMSLPVATGGVPPGVTLAPPTTAPDGGDPSPIGSMVGSATTPASIVVHVAGAVARPGVHSLSPSARVADAVDAAGGAVADADLDGLNLAAPLADGQRVYVPRLGEVDPAAVPSGAPTATAHGGTPAPSGPVDINVATAADLDALPGVGPTTAAAIVDDRTRNGPFASVDDLDRVSGIGPAKLAALRDLVTV